MTRSLPSRRASILGPLLFGIVLAGCGADEADGSRRVNVALSGGATTVYENSTFAYMLPAPGLTEAEMQLHAAGDTAFEARFVTAPAPVNPGLGPVFNNNSCNGCHIRNGRGMPEIGDTGLRSQMLVRVSLPPSFGEPAHPGGAVPLPGVGTQLGDHAIFGVEPEAEIELRWVEETGQYADGTPFSLRRPTLDILLADGEPLPDAAMTSLRQPPPIFGLGLLEAVPDAALIDKADPQDADGDGISGRPNYVWSVAAQKTVLGRFGHKANQPTILQQTAGAYFDDMGVTSPLLPGPDGSSEIDWETLRAAEFYSMSLGVPARRNVDDPEVRRGERIFSQIGCADCHTPTLHTGPSEVAVLANQTFHAYTDLLLHDMGPGLADGRPDFEAGGREWRTPPLWGIGLTQKVAPGAGYLHDGRARTFAEAILWHGGEAQPAREAFRTQLSAAERDALIEFLRSL
jgi:CxxC motif-containing protein (DUF1111 family)